MASVFNVLRCYKCETFQVQQQKKTGRWSCKVCEEKQSVKQIYGSGAGYECRMHVQKLNKLKGEIENNRLKLNNDEDGEKDFSEEEEDYNEDKRNNSCEQGYGGYKHGHHAYEHLLQSGHHKNEHYTSSIVNSGINKRKIDRDSKATSKWSRFIDSSKIVLSEDADDDDNGHHHLVDFAVNNNYNDKKGFVNIKHKKTSKTGITENQKKSSTRWDMFLNENDRRDGEDMYDAEGKGLIHNCHTDDHNNIKKVINNETRQFTCTDQSQKSMKCKENVRNENDQDQRNLFHIETDFESEWLQ
ncbi:hypothetical protein HELRODRAFT_166695 [Helobdella robusta]|uniref:MRN complex-interacting protein N-terminal domain-containing protein n=1 Tax=Helobdella robusta TaxID=6412 RepID=T1EYD6_HELRO|nr:hypothetical protein HELRODRAFT_166695 [Helobdella robusta]ESO11680.1 hypothetical protein HELRODRAFT_166695 [Helobdella robusta]